MTHGTEVWWGQRSLWGHAFSNTSAEPTGVPVMQQDVTYLRPLLGNKQGSHIQLSNVPDAWVVEHACDPRSLEAAMGKFLPN